MKTVYFRLTLSPSYRDVEELLSISGDNAYLHKGF